jgi:drug/metabolite transporter (DMT)-like permease
LIGFFGVVMVVQPGTDRFSIYALLPLAASAFYALVSVTARLFDDEVPSPLVNLYSSFTAAIGAFVLAYFWAGFTPIASATDLGWIIAMGGFGGTAVLFLIVSYRMTEQSNLAPFSYFGIPIAFVLGWLLFDEAPWGTLFPGAILIAAGGLLIVWREKTRSKKG